ncbi:uncharacterized protein [Diadema antillarum]|uniref:uncharacterized protein n=1 Tax=Diadema antillarum TaxID=105358 RepID=UPI003A8AAACF
MSSTSVFSPLAHGCGSWDGDLQQQLEDKKTKVLSKSLPGESLDHLEKRVNIPIRIKSQLSQIRTILREASKNYPQQSQAVGENFADLIRLKTQTTEYSRPLGSVRLRPRTGVIRANKQQSRPSLTGSHRPLKRAKSAPTSRRSSQSPTLPARIDASLPKTLTTRKGALMLFAAPKDVAFSVPEQRCYRVNPNAIDVDDWVSDLQTFQKLTNSVLHYGSEAGDGLEQRNAPYDTSCFKFLHKEEGEHGVDFRLQPGGDFVFYLKDMKTKAAVRNVITSISQANTPAPDMAEELSDVLEKFEEDGSLEPDGALEEQIESVPPKTEFLRPAILKSDGQVYSETSSNADMRSVSHTINSTTTETTVRFASDSTQPQQIQAEANLLSRPDTARSNRSIGSIRSGTPFSLKDLTASLKSGGYLGRPVSAPYPPYSPQARTPSLPPENEDFGGEQEEEGDGYEDVEEEWVVDEEARAASVKSRSRQSSHHSSRQSSHHSSRPKSSRPTSRRSQISAGGHPEEDEPSRAPSSGSRRSRAESSRSRKSSAGMRSQQGEDAGAAELGGEDDDDWQSEDLAELGVEDLEPDVAEADAPHEAGMDAVDAVEGEEGPMLPHRSNSRTSSLPPRVYTPRTRSSRRSTPPPEGDEWPGLDDNVGEVRPGSGRTRTGSAKSRQSSRSRPGTSGSARTAALEDVEETVQEEMQVDGEEKWESPVEQGESNNENLQLFGEGVGIPKEQEITSKSSSEPSRPSTSHTPTPQLAPEPAPITKPASPVVHVPTPPTTLAPTVVTSHAPTPPPPRVQSAAKKSAGDKPKKAEKLDLSSLQSMVAKKNESSIPKPEKTKPSPKPSPQTPRKARKGKKGGGSSPVHKKGGVEFIDSGGASAYEEPSQDEINKMIQEELAQQLAEANINVEEEKREEQEEDKGDPNDTDRASVATDDEAIEKELKTQTPKGTKKTKKQQAKERAALKEARRLEKQRREEEKKALLEKRKAAEEEKRRQAYEEERKKMEIEEQLKEAEYQARLAEEAEEEARLMLQESRRAAREEREKKRKEEMEKKKEERERQREERRKMEEAARQREREMAERLADAAERRRLREEAEWEAEEREREERERREREEDEERRKMEEEEERIRELEREAEQEALERLARERREAEAKMREAREDAERQKAEEERKMREELKRLAEEEEKRRQKELEEQKRREEELEKIRMIQRMEEEARDRVRRKLESRRLWAFRRRERNNEHRGHLNGLRNTQGMTRPWVFSYYVHWPRDTYEKRLPSKDKKKRGFRPRPKPKPPADGAPTQPPAIGLPKP